MKFFIWITENISFVNWVSKIDLDKMKMSSKVNLIILTICVILTFVKGNCSDDSSDGDCACTTGSTWAIGTCTCIKTSVRQGQPCAFDSLNNVDSVRYFWIGNFR